MRMSTRIWFRLYVPLILANQDRSFPMHHLFIHSASKQDLILFLDFGSS